MTLVSASLALPTTPPAPTPHTWVARAYWKEWGSAELVELETTATCPGEILCQFEQKLAAEYQPGGKIDWFQRLYNPLIDAPKSPTYYGSK